MKYLQGICRYSLVVLFCGATSLFFLVILFEPPAAKAELSCLNNESSAVEHDLTKMSVEDLVQRQDELETEYKKDKREEALARERAEEYAGYIKAMEAEQQTKEPPLEFVKLQMELEDMQQSAEYLACVNSQKARMKEKFLKEIDALWKPPSFEETGGYTIALLPPLPETAAPLTASEKLEIAFNETIKQLPKELAKKKADFSAFLNNSDELRKATDEMKKNKKSLWDEVDRSYELLLSEMEAVGLSTDTIKPPAGYNKRHG